MPCGAVSNRPSGRVSERGGVEHASGVLRHTATTSTSAPIRHASSHSRAPAPAPGPGCLHGRPAAGAALAAPAAARPRAGRSGSRSGAAGRGGACAGSLGPAAALIRGGARGAPGAVAAGGEPRNLRSARSCFAGAAHGCPGACRAVQRRVGDRLRPAGAAQRVRHRGHGLQRPDDSYSDWPHLLRWLDGSTAGYGPEGGTGPNQLAYLRIPGQQCLYNVWSNLGPEHLVQLLERLRFVNVAGQGTAARP